MTSEEKLKHFEDSVIGRANELSREMLKEYQESLDKEEEAYQAEKNQQALFRIKTEIENLKREVIDEIIPVEDAEAIAAAREFARTEGIQVGISSGAALHAALRLAARPENAGRTIVALLPDGGDRYYSTALFEA